MRHTILKICFYKKIRGRCILKYMRPHEEVAIGHLKSKTKFKVSGNTSETLNIHQKGTGNMNTPSEQNTINSSNIEV